MNAKDLAQPGYITGLLHDWEEQGVPGLDHLIAVVYQHIHPNCAT